MEESSVSPHQDQIPSIIISVPSAPPPPDIVTSISEVEVVTEPINPDPEAANDTNQLVSWEYYSTGLTNSFNKMYF